MLGALAVFVGGGLGALARWQLGLWLGAGAAGGAWPWGTFAANVIGGLLIGIAMAMLARAGEAGEPWRLLLVVGVLGGFTTFSAFSFETVRLIEAGHWGAAGLYVAGSVLMSLLATFAGLALGRLAPLA